MTQTNSTAPASSDANFFNELDEAAESKDQQSLDLPFTTVPQDESRTLETPVNEVVRSRSSDC